MKKYRTWYKDEIEPVEVESETEKFVVIDGRRSMKHPDRASDQHYHDTYEAARSFLRDDAKHKILMASQEMERQQARLEKIERLGEDHA